MTRGRAPTFRPRAMIVLLYFAAFFFAIAMLLIIPELLKVLGAMAPGPEQEEMAKKVAQATAGPRLPYAFILATFVTALGAYYRVLPGLK